MNGTIHGSTLPELKDEDVLRLYDICQRATRSNDPPYRSLFNSYGVVLRENNIQEKHESVLYRWVMAIGDGARKKIRALSDVDLVLELNTLLEPRGLQIHDDEHPEVEGENNGATQTISAQLDGTAEKPKANRRVSFGDAFVEETWLSEHSLPLYASPPTPAARLLAEPPKRGRDFNLALRERRAQSANSQHDSVVLKPLIKDHKLEGNSVQDSSEFDATVDERLLYDPSQDLLDQNADAFFSTTLLRIARRYLHRWHDTSIEQHERHLQAYAIAANYDRRELLKTSLNVWRAALHETLQEKQAAAHWERLEDRAEAKRSFFLLYKAFTHWVRMGLDARRETEVATRHILRVKYFLRWKTIAAENLVKTRSILHRKYLKSWQERCVQRQDLYEQAAGHYTCTVARKCLRILNWEMVESRTGPWREAKLKRKVLTLVSEKAKKSRELHDQASSYRTVLSIKKALIQLQKTHSFNDHHHGTAVFRRDEKLKRFSFKALRASTMLAPIKKSIALKIDLNLQRKCFDILYIRTLEARKAAIHHNMRLLKGAWTGWNDELRIKALSQPINERLMSETMCKWLMQSKLNHFRNWTDGRLLQFVVKTWIRKFRDIGSRVNVAQVTFDQHQVRRLMSASMVRLNSVLRHHEDGQRAALEFTNARTLPKVLTTWKAKTDHARRLARWASDARWYYLATSSLKLWRIRTTEHQHQRRREAYVLLRARVKKRIAQNAIRVWQDKVCRFRGLSNEAENLAKQRLVQISIAAFNGWKSKAVVYRSLEEEASSVDGHKLLEAAFKSLSDLHVQSSNLDKQARDFRQDTEMALLAIAFRRLQWLTFTSDRRTESAVALRSRNNDQHIRQMLRHWAAQTAAKRDTNAIDEYDAPESPSTRPASRARTRSVSRERDVILPPQNSGHPAYMRSPSRSSRFRASRFKTLPTPAPVTPMNFTPAFLASTIPTTEAGSKQGNISNSPDQRAVFTTRDGRPPTRITPFSRKLRAGGFTPAAPPPSALRRLFGRSLGGASGKSVRFTNARQRNHFEISAASEQDENLNDAS